MGSYFWEVEGGRLLSSTFEMSRKGKEWGKGGVKNRKQREREKEQREKLICK